MHYPFSDYQTSMPTLCVCFLYNDNLLEEKPNNCIPKSIQTSLPI